MIKNSAHLPSISADCGQFQFLFIHSYGYEFPQVMVTHESRPTGESPILPPRAHRQGAVAHKMSTCSCTETCCCRVNIGPSFTDVSVAGLRGGSWGQGSLLRFRGRRAVRRCHGCLTSLALSVDVLVRPLVPAVFVIH